MIVYIKWIDAAFTDQDTCDIEPPSPVVMHTVGFLVKDAIDHIVVAHEWEPVEGTFRKMTAIPKINIVVKESWEPTREG